MLLFNKGLLGSILNYASVCYSGMARTHFLKLERLRYRGLRIVLGLMQLTPNNSLEVFSGVSPLAERCMYLNYKYLVTVFHKHGHPLRERVALVSVSEIDETMTDALASVDKSMYPSVVSRKLVTVMK
jgi:hypothetical protein